MDDPKDASPPSALGERRAPDVRRELERMVEEARAIAIAPYEELDGEALAPLAHQARAVLESALAMAHELLERFDAPAPSFDDDEPPSAIMGRTLEEWAEAPSGREQIANLAFVSALALGTRLTELERFDPARSKWELIEVASGAVRDIVKSMSALDVALAALDGQSIENRFYITELERSLRVRRAYVTFHRGISGLDAQPGVEAWARLRFGATAIAKLVGRDEYPSMRILDRRAFRTFQAKIQAHLAQGPGEVAKGVTGERLWRDLVSFAELLLLVNNRAELIEHDRRLVTTTLAALERGEGSPSSVAQTLSPMLGRSPDVDALLRQSPPPPLELWLEALRRCVRLHIPREQAA